VNLVLCAFLMSILIISTQVYVYKGSRYKPSTKYSNLVDYLLHLEKGSKHVVTVSLINISQGGDTSALSDNLERWKAFVGADYKFGIVYLNYTLSNQSPYSDGIRLDWGINGIGISSASVNVSLSLSGRGANVEDDFSENVTSTVLLSGWWETISGNRKRVTVIVNLLNEGGPALAGSISLEYLRGNWRDPSVLDIYSEMDYGNGTYRYYFEANIPGSVEVRVEIYDRRDLYIQTEATLPQV
jgi:hypothetical protein